MTVDAKVIRDSLAFYGYHDGDIVELRALNYVNGAGKPRIYSGYFDKMDAVADIIARHEDRATGWYITMNALRPEVAERVKNKIAPAGNTCTKKEDIIRRTRILVDIDPCRQSGTASTQVQLDAAVARAKDVELWLTSNGWPAPARLITGNGSALVYKIDEPTDDQYVEKVVELLGMRFSDEMVNIDTSVTDLPES